MRLNDPEAVRREYANESRLAVRAAAWETATGPDARHMAFNAVAEVAPRRVLEVGCGRGELAERIKHELGVDVRAVDSSERMVELTRARGVDARVGDVQQLPFADGEFDCALAAWMLYHVPDLDLGLSELAVERREARGTVTFPDWEAAHRYVSASTSRAHLADELPRFEGPLVASRLVVVFVAEKA